MHAAPIATSEMNTTSGPRITSPDPVDVQHLRRYTFGDQALEKEILHLFLAQLPESIALLDAASTERDWKMAAHTLKGSGRTVGAGRIADLAQDAERLTFGVGSVACGEAVSRLKAAAAEARTFIESIY